MVEVEFLNLDYKSITIYTKPQVYLILDTNSKVLLRVTFVDLTVQQARKVQKQIPAT